jgi:outer membrane protein TolC
MVLIWWRSRTAIVALILLVAPQAARAAAPPPSLDLHAAVAFALDHNSGIAQRRATVAQDNATFVRQRAAELPSITGTLQNQLQRSQNASGGIYAQFGLSPANEFSQNTAEISSTWNIFTGSSAQIQTQEAKRTLQQAQLALDRAEQQLAADVTSSFYGLAGQHETVRLDEADRTYQGQLLGAAQAQERNGRIAQVDVLRAQVDTLRSDVTLATARNTEADDREALAQQIGASPDTTFAVDGAIPEPPLPAMALAAMVEVARAHRSDVLAARAALQYAVLTNANIDTDLLPQVQITGAFGNVDSPTTVAYSPLTGLPTGVRGSPGFWQIGSTATFSLPIVDYGTRSAAHHAARALIDANQQALTVAENGVAVDVRAALRGAQTAYANLQTSKQAAALGGESARIAQLQYRNGLISLTDATQAQQSALQAGTDLITARANYVTAIVRLRVAIGADTPLAAIDFGVS